MIKKHDSMRGWFAYELHQAMLQNEDIYLVAADLGYGMLDQLRNDYRDRVIVTGASEQAAMGMCVGLALSGLQPFFYSITTFALYRPFETIRNYIHHEETPVTIVGAGRNKDYSHDGFSHWSEDYLQVLNALPNITVHLPDKKEEMPKLVKEITNYPRPRFVSLRR